MPETVRSPKIVFTAVSAVLLLGLSGCDPYKEVGLCTYLLGCGSDKTPTDPGMSHYIGTFDIYGDEDSEEGGDMNDNNDDSEEH